METKKISRRSSVFAAMIILLIGVFIGGYLVLKSGKISAGELNDILKGQPVNLFLCEPDANNAARDSDNDGLKDWQELQLYQTNPCQQDSDNDGYLDGEEIASGYDPAKKAPGDELPGTTPKTPRPLPDNLTIALQRVLSEQLRANKISPLDADGGLLSSRELEQFPGIQQAVWSITQHRDQLFAPEPINEKQIKTVADNSAVAIKAYARDAADAIPATDNSDKNSEATMFLSAMETDDFSRLDTHLADYQIAYQKLRDLTVPSDLVNLHKEQLDIFSITIKIYQAVKEINEDPLKANLALQKYQDIILRFSDWMEKVAAFLETHSE